MVGLTASDGFVGEVRSKVCSDPTSLLLLGIPSVLYFFQNLSIYVALENLDPAVFQVVYQLKLLVAAVLSRLVFRHRVVPVRRWVALVVLFVGIALASLPEGKRAGEAPASSLFGVVVCVSSGVFWT